MTSANRLTPRTPWLLLSTLLFANVAALHAQVPDLAPAKKPAASSKSGKASAQTPAATAEPTPAPTSTAPAPAPQAAAAPADTSASAGEGPFGFYAGETRLQIIAAIGKAAIKKEKKDTLEVTAAPKPDAHFDTYTLIISPKSGLLKIVATGKDLNDDANGEKVKSEFAAVKTDITTVYGPATEAFDFIKSTSKHKGTDQYILALTNQERTLAAYWTKATFPAKVNSISLEADGLGNDLGYLSLEFEFNGYAAFITAK